MSYGNSNDDDDEDMRQNQTFVYNPNGNFTQIPRRANVYDSQGDLVSGQIGDGQGRLNDTKENENKQENENNQENENKQEEKKNSVERPPINLEEKVVYYKGKRVQIRVKQKRNGKFEFSSSFLDKSIFVQDDGSFQEVSEKIKLVGRAFESIPQLSNDEENMVRNEYREYCRQFASGQIRTQSGQLRTLRNFVDDYNVSTLTAESEGKSQNFVFTTLLTIQEHSVISSPSGLRSNVPNFVARLNKGLNRWGFSEWKVSMSYDRAVITISFNE